MVKRMWHACYGDLDEWKSWDRDLEMYMKQNGLTYNRPLERSKGHLVHSDGVDNFALLQI